MTRPTTLIASLIAVVALLVQFGSAIASPSPSAFGEDRREDLDAGKIIIANRGSGTLSVISVTTDEVVTDIALPGPLAEPMYVVYVPSVHRVFVGDRAHNRVVVYDADDLSLEGTVSVGAGVFHMWANPQGTQLWVNNDIDGTASIVNPLTLEVVAIVPMPADLVALGGKPHDVVLDTRFAYVTLVGLPDQDYVVKISQRTYQEMARAAVGKDPHVSLTLRNNLLYVPSQGANTVFVLDRKSLQAVEQVPVPGAHGAGMARKGKTFYTTNLPGGGVDGLVAIDTRSNRVIGTPVNTPYPVPHNIALIPNGRKLYVTHSGATADRVTVYTADRDDRVPTPFTEVTVGVNPFGLSYVP